MQVRKTDPGYTEYKAEKSRITLPRLTILEAAADEELEATRPYATTKTTHPGERPGPKRRKTWQRKLRPF